MSHMIGIALKVGYTFSHRCLPAIFPHGHLCVVHEQAPLMAMIGGIRTHQAYVKTT